MQHCPVFQKNQVYEIFAFMANLCKRGDRLFCTNQISLSTSIDIHRRNSSKPILNRQMGDRPYLVNIHSCPSDAAKTGQSTVSAISAVILGIKRCRKLFELKGDPITIKSYLL